MRVTGAILADLERSPLETRSRLTDDLAGVPILRRTAIRALKSRELATLHVAAPQAQAARVFQILDGLPIHVESHAVGPAPYHTLVRSGRWWGLDGWRGGAGGFCSFDEDFHTPIVHALAEKTGADAVATIPAAAPLLDAELLDEMIRHARTVDEPTGITFVQAPPGLGAFIIRRAILDQLVSTAIPPGAILAYQPSSPTADLTGRDACFRPAIEIIHASGRLLCDTKRSTDRVERLIHAGAAEWNAKKIAAALSEMESTRVDEFPREIEIELTTDVPTAWHPILRPVGGRADRRGPMATNSVRAIAESLGHHDDVRIILAGFGDPCLHPDFDEVCRILRSAGAAAIGVRTSGLATSPAVESALFDTPVDLVEVMLDAANGETYRRVFGLDAFEKAMSILEERLSRRERERRVRPLWMPSMVKAAETLDDVAGFVDQWQRRLGMYVLSGYSRCAGQCDDHAVSLLSQPARTRCRRVRTRTVILADGRVTTCDQDFRGLQTLGSLENLTLSEIWRDSAALNNIRSRVVGDAPLCARCDEWRRP